MESGATYSFDGFVFDPVTGELCREGAPPGDGTRLPPKPARMLSLLLERAGELVPREEMVEALWPGQHLDVDQALAYTVRQVRAALDDDAGEPRYVETLPRRGYRFVGRLGAREAPRRRPARSALRSGTVVIVLIVALIAIYGWFWLGAQRELERRMASGAPVAERDLEPVRVALLPLAPPPEASTPATIAVNDRLTERLLVALTARPELDLVGTATTARLRATRRPHPEVGRELGVAFVASGGFRPHPDPGDPDAAPGGESGTLFLQLVRTSDGGHLFAESYLGTEAELVRRLPEAAGAMAAVASQAARAALWGSPPRPASPVGSRSPGSVAGAS